jgi:integration host factor subunit alpha
VTRTKHDIVELLYDKLQVYSKKEVAQIVETFFELLKESLEKEQDVVLSGFGKFQVTHKAKRIGRNPRTGEVTEISARKVVTFHPSSVLRKKINNG